MKHKLLISSLIIIVIFSFIFVFISSASDDFLIYLPYILRDFPPIPLGTQTPTPSITQISSTSTATQTPTPTLTTTPLPTPEGPIHFVGYTNQDMTALHEVAPDFSAITRLRVYIKLTIGPKCPKYKELDIKENITITDRNFKVVIKDTETGIEDTIEGTFDESFSNISASAFVNWIECTDFNCYASCFGMSDWDVPRQNIYIAPPSSNLQISTTNQSPHQLTAQSWEIPVNISNLANKSSSPQMVIDHTGALHVVWYEYTSWGDDGEIYYNSKSQTGTWSSPLNISNSLKDSKSPDIAKGKDGQLHLVWAEGDDGQRQIYYTTKPLQGNWATPIVIPDSSDDVDYPRIAVDDGGTVHIIWGLRRGNEADYFRYITKPPGQDWTPYEDIPGGESLDNLSASILKFDSLGALHLFWGRDYIYEPGRGLGHAMKPAGGNWLNHPTILTDGLSAWWPNIVEDSSGTIHLLWHAGSDSCRILYATKPSGGGWSPLFEISPGQTCTPSMAIDAMGTLHLLWNEHGLVAPYRINYFTKPPGQWWITSGNMPGTLQYPVAPAIAIDDAGGIHAQWVDTSEIYVDPSDVYYAEKSMESGWSSAVNISNTGEAWGDYLGPVPILVIDGDDTLHSLWIDNTPGNSDLYYTSKQLSP